MRSQAIQKGVPLRAQAAAPERPVALLEQGPPQAMICTSGRSLGCPRHGGSAPVSGPSCARISRTSPDFLRDISIEVHEAQAEASRFLGADHVEAPVIQDQAISSPGVTAALQFERAS
jgi:hypothetical protein